MPTQDYITKLVKDVGEDVDFTRGPWVSAVEFEGGITSSCFRDMKTCCKNEKLPKVVALIKSCTPNALDDLSVTLKDPSGTLFCTIHYKLLSEDGFRKTIIVEAVLILTNVFVFSHKQSSHSLKITMTNVVRVFLKDTVLGDGTGVGGQDCVMPTQDYITKLVKDVGEDADFTRGPWVSAVEFEGGITSSCFRDMKTCCQNEKLPKVVALVKSCTPNALDDLSVTLKDPSAGNPVTEVLLKLILPVHRIRRWRYNLSPAESKFKTPMLDQQDKYMMKAQVQVSKSFAISDVQPLPRRKHYCQIYQVVKHMLRGRLLASFQDHEHEGGDTRSQDGLKDNDSKIKIQDHSMKMISQINSQEQGSKIQKRSKEIVTVDETVDDKEVWDNVKLTDDIFNEVKARYGEDHKKITDEQLSEFLDDLFNKTDKELMVNKGIISKGKHVEVIIISDDDTEDDAFFVSDSEDDAFYISNFEDDAFHVSDSENDTDVMWVVANVHASTSKVSTFREHNGGRKKNSSEVKKPTSNFKGPYNELRITGCILGLRASRSAMGYSSSEKGAVGCSSIKQSNKKGAMGCSSIEEVVMDHDILKVDVVTVDETVDDKEVWDNVKLTDDICNEVKARYGEDHKKVTDEHLFEFFNDLFNKTDKELMVNKGKRIEALEGVFGISDSEDDAFYISNFEDDAFHVSDSEDDTVVMWVVANVHASTSKVSTFREHNGGRKKNSSEVKKHTSDFKGPYNELRITGCILGLRASRSAMGYSSSKKGAVGCSSIKQSNKKGAMGCSSIEEVVMDHDKWHRKVLGRWFPRDGFVVCPKPPV
nr:hypothetical protein [Tanacetum cinerariifolium]